MQDAFVRAWHELPASLSKRERARRAAIAAGYSPATAGSAGSKLIAKPHILERIITTHERTLAARSGIDAVWVLNELAELWETPLTDLFDEDGRLLDIDQLPPGAQKLIAGFDITEETEIDGGRRRITTRVSKIKLIDRLAVLEKISRNHHVAAYTSPEQKAAESSMARLWRALEQQAAAAVEKASAIDVTPNKKERSFTNGLGAQYEREADSEGSE